MKRRGRSIVLVLSFIIMLLGGQLRSRGQEQKPLEEMTLEELMEVPITTALRISEPLKDTPATTYVITADQIRDRGYRDIEDI